MGSYGEFCWCIAPEQDRVVDTTGTIKLTIGYNGARIAGVPEKKRTNYKCGSPDIDIIDGLGPLNE